MTPERRDYVRGLEAGLDLEISSLERIMELGHWYIGPPSEHAVRMFEAVLKRDPGNREAMFWIADVCVYYLFDPQRAKELIQPLIEKDDEWAAAAYQLLASVRYDESQDTGAARADTLTERLALLETSVAKAPDWITNRESLAEAYKWAGRYSEAVEQVKKAIANVWSSQPNTSEWPKAKWDFEALVTGRTCHEDDSSLQARLERLEQIRKGRENRKNKDK
jgi:tetratricopeptide (TPR) repeat protein